MLNLQLMPTLCILLLQCSPFLPCRLFNLLLLPRYPTMLSLLSTTSNPQFPCHTTFRSDRRGLQGGARARRHRARTLQPHSADIFQADFLKLRGCDLSQEGLRTGDIEYPSEYLTVLQKTYLAVGNAHFVRHTLPRIAACALDCRSARASRSALLVEGVEEDAVLALAVA